MSKNKQGWVLVDSKDIEQEGTKEEAAIDNQMKVWKVS